MAGDRYEPNAPQWPFLARELLTPSEKIFHVILQEALPEYVIYVQVPLSQMLRVEKGHNKYAWNNRINRMSVDFVVSDASTRIIAAIELDDPSHDNPMRQAADAKKDKALTSAGIRILRWRVESMPDAGTIRSKVLEEDSPPSVVSQDVMGEPPAMILMRAPPKSLFERYGFALFGVLVGSGVIGLAMTPRESPQMVENPPLQSPEPISEPIQQPAMPLPVQAPPEGTSRNMIFHGEMQQNGRLRNFDHTPVDSLTTDEEECRSWRNSNVLEPTPEKRQKIAELCPGP